MFHENQHFDYQEILHFIEDGVTVRFFSFPTNINSHNSKERLSIAGNQIANTEGTKTRQGLAVEMRPVAESRPNQYQTGNKARG